MPTMTETARAFFEACESGKGWEACRQYCAENASFTAQSEPLTEIKNLAAYCDWVASLAGPLPGNSYAVKSFATDEERGNVCAYGVFTGTHTGPGGPVPPTGKQTVTDYVYVMDFANGRIRHMTKIWNAPWALRELGWA